MVIVASTSITNVASSCGAGIRTADDQLELFEQVINLVRRHAPGAAIAFNATPSDTYEAAARWIDVAE